MGIEYNDNGTPSKVGNWKHGYRDGIWSFYDTNGKLEYKVMFDNGRFVYKEIIGQEKKITFDELTPEEKLEFESPDEDNQIEDQKQI